MGNNQPRKRQGEINQIWQSAESKAHQIIAWYREERFPDSTTPEFDSVSEHIFKPFNLLKNGRTIGTMGLKKILKNISPLRLLNFL